MALSVPLYAEYRSVLSRIETRRLLGLSAEDVEVIMRFIALIGRPFDSTYSWRPNLRDEDDNMVLELARASRSDYLLTRNRNDFTIGADSNNDDIRIASPAEFVREWRMYHEE